MNKWIDLLYSVIYSSGYRRALNIAALLGLTFIALRLAFTIHINGDAGYYLASAAEIAHGITPFVDFHLIYTPLALYFFSIPYLLFGDRPDFTMFLLCQYVVIAGICLIVRRLVTELSNSRTFATIVAALVFLQILQLEGQFIVLEPLTLLFGLAAIFCVSRNRWYSALGAGLLVCSAFLTKQYGLGFAVPCAVYLLLSHRCTLKACALFSAGFLVPLVTATTALMVLSELPLTAVSAFFFNKDYGIRTLDALGHKLFVFFVTNQLFLVSTLLLIGVSLLRQRASLHLLKIRPLVGALWSAGLVMASTLYFPPSAFQHYAILFLPFFLISVALFFSERAKQGRLDHKLILLVFVGTMVFAINPIIRWGLFQANRQTRIDQLAMGNLLSRQVPPDSKVTILHGDFEKFRFISALRSPLPESVGYDYFYLLSDSLKAAMVDNSDYVLAKQGDTLYLSELQRHHFSLIGHAANIDIWSRNPKTLPDFASPSFKEPS